MKLIQKYELNVQKYSKDKLIHLWLPKFAEILCVSFPLNDEKLFLWAKFDRGYATDLFERRFTLEVDGIPFDDPHCELDYIGTAIGCSGGLVVHVFEKVELD